MRYLFAFICPPLAVVLCGRPGLAVLNFLFTLMFWIPGIIHALLIVSGKEADDRARRTAMRYDYH